MTAPNEQGLFEQSRIAPLFREWYRLMAHGQMLPSEQAAPVFDAARTIELELLAQLPLTAQDLAMQIMAFTCDGDFNLDEDWEKRLRTLCGVGEIKRLGVNHGRHDND